MKAVCFLIILGVCLAWPIRADYVLNLSSEGATTREVFAGTRISLTASLQAQSGETHNAAIFRLEFSAPGLVYESYDWPFPYDNETLSDDSKPLFRQLPLSLNANTLSGAGYPDGVVDIELSNVVDSVDRFGAGTLVEMSFRIPEDQPLGPLTITPVVDALSNGFNLVPAQAGTAVQFNVIAKPPQFNTAPILSVIPNQSLDEDSSILGLLFDASDNEQLPHQLSLSATSSNQNRVRNANITISGSGNQRFMSITPEPNVFGAVNIIVSVNDGQLTTQRAFTLTIHNVNDPPGIGTIAPQSTLEDQPLVVSLNLLDIDNPVSALQVTGKADNPGLFPDGSIQYSASPAPRLTLTPANNQFGQARIEVVVSDGEDETSRTFEVNVQGLNDPPAIGAIADLELQEDQPGMIAFEISDPETPSSQLELAVVHDNPGLFPEGNVQVEGVGEMRTLRLSPALNQGGLARFELSVSDGSLQLTRQFVVRVHPVNDAPSLSAIADQRMNENSFLILPVQVSDVDNEAGDLELAALSEDDSLVSSAGFAWAGEGGVRSLTITPVANAAGEVRITVRVSDPGDAAQTISFVLRIEEVDIASTPEFIEWIRETNLPEGRDKPEDDADGDGIPNIVEFAFASDPLSSDNQNLPRSVIVEEGGTSFPGVTFVRNRSVSGLGIQVIASTTLDLSNPLPTQEIVEDLGNGQERVTLRTTEPPGGVSAMFFITLVRVQ